MTAHRDTADAQRSIDDPCPVLYRRKHVAGAGTKLTKILDRP
jgi:hypothetical protein